MNSFILKLFVLLSTLMIACNTKSTEFLSHNDFPFYDKSDEGLTYSKDESIFKIWSPQAEDCLLKLYSSSEDGEPLETYQMNQENNGIWQYRLPRDLAGMFYTFQIRHHGEWLEETPGVWAKAVGTNGLKAAIIDLNLTNPQGWESDRKPTLNNPGEILLYELHIRDYTIHPDAGNSNPGKYIGLVETGTKSSDGLNTGIDHIKELGITHVHLLPCFDHRSIDESKLDSAQYNWGYDPQNYNVPEGSFSSNPADPTVRIKEFKEMVMKFHQNGLRVIMDVVYNHTGLTENSNFNLSAPGYYYRQNAEGGWSDASACGNETASERAMMRKFIIESCKYWVQEYHIDGFRIDLMGIHDIETMNQLSAELHEIDPSIFLYGEGWKAGNSPMPDSLLALKQNAMQLDRIAVFSDDLRDGIKGSVFDDLSRGFVSGARDMEESIKFGAVASTHHPQIDYQKVNYSKAAYNKNPYQTIAYVSCHDNHTLNDKLSISTQGQETEENLERMHKMAIAIVLTSQGIPFLHAGVEMKRTKYGAHNSYNLPDSINQILWKQKSAHFALNEYVKKLIGIRKSHPAFRMKSEELIKANLKFIEGLPPQMVAFELNGTALGDDWAKIMVVHNANHNQVTLTLDAGEWKLAMSTEGSNQKDSNSRLSNSFEVPSLSSSILYQEK